MKPGTSLFLIASMVLSGQAALAVSGEAFEVCRHSTEDAGALVLRDSPSSTSGVVMELEIGAVVEGRQEPRGPWLAVVVESMPGVVYLRDLPAGFVHTSHLCPI
jgi:hypothetical protein